ncbi:MAG: YchJ family protein [Treponema sp.]|jgi:SEC-C motif-containing protein|nr:YchJ family protein [Treponema sp.]
MKLCHCGSGSLYQECCEPFIIGTALPPTAEALMRSRYSAYVEHAINYIVSTCTKTQERIDEKQTRAWSEQSEWLKLEILSVAEGREQDSTGTVEFKAYYKHDGIPDVHHEKAFFKKQGGKWVYDTGKMIIETVVRSSPKVGRNEPCPCGSGKKYKYCCGSRPLAERQ